MNNSVKSRCKNYFSWYNPDAVLTASRDVLNFDLTLHRGICTRFFETQGHNCLPHPISTRRSGRCDCRELRRSALPTSLVRPRVHKLPNNRRICERRSVAEVVLRNLVGGNFAENAAHNFPRPRFRESRRPMNHVGRSKSADLASTVQA